MIIKAVITYEDGTEVTFNGTPAVPEVITPAVPAQPVDLSAIPLTNV